jgi:hypothetical protein
LPRSIEGASLLSPFDPVVWFRPRAERVFNFHYRIEIYVPEAKRRWGYYVLPFRMGDRIVARVDLKADRKNGRLLVLAAHEEPGVPGKACAESLADELTSLAEWLALGDIHVAKNSGFARTLLPFDVRIGLAAAFVPATIMVVAMGAALTGGGTLFIRHTFPVGAHLLAHCLALFRCHRVAVDLHLLTLRLPFFLGHAVPARAHVLAHSLAFLFRHGITVCSHLFPHGSAFLVGHRFAFGTPLFALRLPFLL